ncbi:hypothetical protein I549_2556 [Mycobacterium avium subsp. avium 2285 (R)]|nr:hypothetical protein I549_2556 [Mycobacterium avium subsp. avium 2285 (R)]
MRLRSVAETLAAEAAAFVRRRRAEVFGTEPGGASAPTAARCDPRARRPTR